MRLSDAHRRWTIRGAISRRLAALEAAQRAQELGWSVPVSVVEYDEDGEVLRVVREVPARRFSPP
jgi:hypothetical protein